MYSNASLISFLRQNTIARAVLGGIVAMLLAAPLPNSRLGIFVFLPWALAIYFANLLLSPTNTTLEVLGVLFIYMIYLLPFAFAGGWLMTGRIRPALLTLGAIGLGSIGLLIYMFLTTPFRLF